MVKSHDKYGTITSFFPTDFVKIIKNNNNDNLLKRSIGTKYDVETITPSIKNASRKKEEKVKKSSNTFVRSNNLTYN
jgi:hypothetical protein